MESADAGDNGSGYLNLVLFFLNWVSSLNPSFRHGRVSLDLEARPATKLDGVKDETIFAWDSSLFPTSMSPDQLWPVFPSGDL